MADELPSQPQLPGVDVFELMLGFEVTNVDDINRRTDYLGSTNYWVSDIRGYASVAYVCPQCGELWGRRRYLNIPKHLEMWVARMRGCKNHGSGSLFEQYDFLEPLLKELPAPLIRHELRVWRSPNE